MPGLDLPRFWDGLEQAAGVALEASEERALARSTLLGWSAVRRLRSVGMDVQSYCTSTSSSTACAGSTRRSMTWRDRGASSARRSARRPSAWPTPSATSSRELAPEALGAADVELGFTNSTGLCLRLDPGDPFNIPRVSMDLGMSAATYKARLLLGDGRWSRHLEALAPADADAERARDSPEPASAEAATRSPGVTRRGLALARALRPATTAPLASSGEAQRRTLTSAASPAARPLRPRVGTARGGQP